MQHIVFDLIKNIIDKNDGTSVLFDRGDDGDEAQKIRSIIDFPPGFLLYFGPDQTKQYISVSKYFDDEFTFERNDHGDFVLKRIRLIDGNGKVIDGLPLGESRQTFKQFLEGYDEFDSLSYELVFRKMGLSADEAKSATQWWEGDKQPNEVGSDAWDKLLEPILGHLEEDYTWDDEVYAITNNIHNAMKSHGLPSRTPLA
jgi:uncharacterized protein YifE (UPF0438 family)